MAIQDVAAALVDVFTAVADRAAHGSGFVRRESKLSGEAFVQAITFGWLRDPDATLDELAQTAAAVGVTITPQGLEKRFGPLGRVLASCAAGSRRPGHHGRPRGDRCPAAVSGRRVLAR